MSKHTKGPWTCHSGSVYVDGPDVYPKGDNEGIPIAHMDREPGNGTEPVERDANAALIAAAPDYHEAAEHILTRSEPNDDGTWTVRMNEMVELRTAYAKAEPKP